MDNAIVGSLYTADYTGISKRVSPFFVAYFKKRGAEKRYIRAEGERPVLFVKRWEPVFQGERTLLSVDRTRLFGFVQFKNTKRGKNK